MFTSHHSSFRSYIKLLIFGHLVDKIPLNTHILVHKLAEADDFVKLDAEAPEGVGEDVTDGFVQIVIAVVLPLVNTALQQPLAVVTQGLQKPVLGFQVLAPDSRIVLARKDHFHFVYSLEGE